MYWWKREEAEQRMRNEASYLSDEMFKDDPEVKACRKTLAAEQKAYEAEVARLPNVDTGDVDERLAALSPEIEKLTNALPELAHADLLAGKLDMPGVTAARERIQRLQWLREDLKSAIDLYRRHEGRRQLPARQAGNRVEQARKTLEETLARLKFAHVQDEAAERARIADEAEQKRRGAAA